MYGDVMFEKGNMFSLREGDFQVKLDLYITLITFKSSIKACFFK